MGAAEKQRRYRVRRNVRKKRDLKKEQQKYREDIASGRKKLVNNISRREKCRRRKEWEGDLLQDQVQERSHKASNHT